MLTLAQGGLRVEILDPKADVARLGGRYCAGGYVWQVEDERHGALFSGPAFPASDPPVFDGQGAPEVFELALGQHVAKLGDEVYVIGVGRVRRESAVRPFHVRDNPTVTERAAWDVSEIAPKTLCFRSHATFGAFAFALERTIALAGRTLTSATRLSSVGGAELPVRWFAHPFFPWAGPRLFAASVEYALPEGAALLEDADGCVARRAGSDWSRGHYLLPRVSLGGELVVDACHPVLRGVRVECQFPLGGLALWGNERTWSFEPFFQTIVAPRATARWAVRYTF